MIRFFLHCLKLGIIAVVVLLISQIHIGKKRICDYVGEITQHHHIQRPIVWVADKFDFTAQGRAHAPRTAPSEKPETTRTRAAGRLSGLYKHQN